MRDSFFGKVYRKSTLNRISKKCKMLGVKTNYDPISFMNIRLLCSLIIFLFLIIIRDDGYISGPIIAILFYYFFEYILDYKIKKRASKLNYEAIFFFQVLVLTLESGRNLKSAIELTSLNIDSEISEEFKKTLKDVTMGKSLGEALVDMKERIPSEEINTVILNINQSTKFGNNIIESLNNQIEYLADKKILNIKATINKMPIKISVVSVVFIIPIVMLLVLGPVVINFLLK